MRTPRGARLGFLLLSSWIALAAFLLVPPCEAAKAKARARRNFLFWRSSAPAPTSKPIAPAKVKADPCKGASDLERCHYEQGLALLENLQDPVAAQPPQAAAAAPEAAATTVLPAAVATAAAQPLKKQPSSASSQAAALKLALEALEGEHGGVSPPPPQLDALTGQLEDALETVEPGALSAFRQTHLAAAFNAVGPAPTRAQRALTALQALKDTSWPTDSGVPVALDALRSMTEEGLAPKVHGHSSLFAQVGSAISTFRGSMSAGFSHLWSRS